MALLHRLARLRETRLPANTPPFPPADAPLPPLKGAQNEPAPETSTSAPLQGELPFAWIKGEAMTQIPKDLYIPPDALEIILESFEGPMDLLLYLIRRQNLDILEIDVSEITLQYVAYVDMMEALQFELAAEYLVMAAMLAEIKSRMLLPRTQLADEAEEEDPRALLIKRLQAYEQFKVAAENLDALSREGRDFYPVQAEPPPQLRPRSWPSVTLQDLLLALSEVVQRADLFESHQVTRERLSTRERMSDLLRKLQSTHFLPFSACFSPDEGRLGLVVTFLAILELVKEHLIELVQNAEFGPIYLRTAAPPSLESQTA